MATPACVGRRLVYLAAAGATSRPVYLPRGVWIDANDKKTRHTGPATITANAPIDVLPRVVRAGAIVPRGDILQSNNNWTPEWKPSLRVEFYPAAGIGGRFDYYTGTGVVTIAGSKAGPAITWRTGDLGVNGVLEVHGIGRYTSVRRNNRSLAGADVRYDAATQTLTIPFSGITSIQIR